MTNNLYIKTFLMLCLCGQLNASMIFEEGVLEQLRKVSGNPHLSEGDALTLLFKGNGLSMLGQNPDGETSTQNIPQGAMLPADKARHVKAGDRESSVLDFFDKFAIDYISTPYPNVYRALKNNDLQGANDSAKQEGFEAFTEVFEDFARQQFKVACEEDLIELFAPKIEQAGIILKNTGIDIEEKGLYVFYQFIENPGHLPPLKAYPSIQKLWQNSQDFASLPLNLTFKAEYKFVFENIQTGEIILSEELF